MTGRRMTLRTLANCAVGVPLALSGCRSPSASSAPAPSTPVAFQASSLESHYAVRGYFNGTVTREPERLVILILDGGLRSSTSGRNLRLRAGLGRRTSRGWAYEPQGPQIPLRDSIARGEEIHLDTLRLTIPVGDGLGLSPYWLAFEIAAKRDEEEFTTYVCTPRDIFRTERSKDPVPTGDDYAFWC